MDRHRPSLRRAASGIALVAIPASFLGLFFVFPLATILDVGLRPDGALDLGLLSSVISDPDLREVAWFTVWQAAASTALTLVLGLPAAYVLTRFSFPGRRLLWTLSLIPFVLPTVVVGTAFIGLFGAASRSLGALLAAHVFFNLAVVIRVVGATWAHLDPALEDAAEILGAGPLRRLRDVLLPLARRAIAGATVLVFLFTFTSFGVVLLLAPAGRSTIEVEIYRYTSQLLNLDVAAALSVVQLAFVGGLLGLESFLASHSDVGMSQLPEHQARRAPRPGAERAIAVVMMLVVAGLVLIPPVRLIWRSLVGPDGITLSMYRDLGTIRSGGVLAVSPLAAVANSITFGAEAGVMAVVVGGVASVAVARARRSWLRGLVALPLGVSAVTIGFGYIVAFDHPPVDLRASAWLVPIAQATVAIPFVVRIVSPVLASIPRDLVESARDLGATPAQAWRVVQLPIASRAILGAAVFAFVISLGEFGATAFLARIDRPTMPIAIFRLLGQPGAASLGQALAMSVLLMAVTAAAALSIERIRIGTFGQF